MLVDFFGACLFRQCGFPAALEIAEKWKGKAKMGVYGVLREELVSDATTAYQTNSYVHQKATSREPIM